MQQQAAEERTVVAEPELDRFLAELTARRRVLTLAGASGSALDAEMLAELAELADQLVVADVELRAQHEELEAGRKALLRSQAAYERLLAEAGTACLLTDQHGVVGQLNPAAEVLLGPLPVRWRRPLAAKFAVEDRSRIRTVLSQLKRSSSEPATCRARLARSDGSLLEVEVTACSVTERPDGATLSWQLRPVSQDSPPGDASAAQPPADLLTPLCDMAAVLAGRHSAQEVLDQAVRVTRHAVSGAEQASVCVMDKDGILQSPSSTGELATECDRAQCQLGEGPCLQAVPDGQVLRIDDLSAETRWPAWAGRARALGAGSMLASQLTTARGALGTLNLYSSRPHAFDSAAEALAQVLAAQVGIALARVDNEANLQAAIQNRQLIGQAVGILMERHRLGPTAAFDLLVQASQFSRLKLREIAQRVNETGLDPVDAARGH